MEKAKRFGDRLILGSGNVLNNSIVSDDDDANKYFAVVAKCGHVGDGYFVPILFSVCAKDKECAKEMICNLARVKMQLSNCILGMKEISYIENIFIRMINRYDPYLVYSVNNESTVARRIISPEIVEKLTKQNRNYKASDKRLNTQRFDIKFAEDYPDYLVLQKYFAPIMIGKEIVYPNFVDMDFVLRDYFCERTRYLGLKRGISQVLVCYEKIFGENNQFNVKLESEKISFINEQGEKCVVDFDAFSHRIIDLETDHRLIDAINSKTRTSQQVDYDKIEGKVKTGLERFNARAQKTKDIEIM